MGRKKKEKENISGVMELKSNDDFRLLISDGVANLSPKDLDSGVMIYVLLGKDQRGISFDFNIFNNKIICKLFTAETKGYPEKFEFSVLQFAKLLKSSNKKKNNPLEDEQSIFGLAARVKQEKLDEQNEQNSPTPKKRGRKRKLT